MFVISVCAERQWGIENPILTAKISGTCRKLPSMFCSEDFKSCEPALTQILRWAVSEKVWTAVRLEDVKRNTICMISGNNDPQMRGCKSKSNCCLTSNQLVTLLTKTCIDYQDSFRVKARRGTWRHEFVCQTGNGSEESYGGSGIKFN